MKKLLLTLGVAALGFTANAEQVTFDFANENYGLERMSGDAKTGYITPGTEVLNGDVTMILEGETITGDNGTTTSWRLWTDGLRAYYKNSPEFTVKATQNITKVTWTLTGGSFALEGTENTITTWTGEAAEVTFVYTGTANKAIKTLTVFYGEPSEDDPDIPDTPAAPEGTITVAAALELMKAGYTGEATVKGIISSIQEVNTQYGNATYFIKDELTDEESLEVFRGKYLNGDAFTSADQIKVGATVEVKGELVDYQGTFEFTTGSTILSYVAPEGDETPDTPDTPDTDDNVIFSEPFSSSLGDFTIDNVTLPEELTYVWSFAANYGAKASAYVGGANWPAESWLISPAISLEGYKEITLSFDQALNYAKGNTNLCQVWIGTTEDRTAETWKEISDLVTYPESDGWTFVNSSEISLADYEGETIYVGFRYTSTSEVGPTWEIKNFVVNGIGDDSDAIETIGSELNAPVEYFNLQGVRVNNPAKGGIYIIRQGNKASKAIVR